MKKLEAEIGASELTLEAFILSETHFTDLINVSKVSRSDLEARNVLFMDTVGTKYIEKFFSKLT